MGKHCPRCEGRGRLQGGLPGDYVGCARCAGTGLLWDIWSEGYAATGEYQPPYCVVRDAPGATFTDACIRWWEGLPMAERRKHGAFDAAELTLWGCRLAPSEDGF